MFKPLLIIMLLACTFSLNAQKVSVGLTGSLGIASINTSSNGINSRLGSSVGGVIVIPINQNFGVQLEGLLALKGCKFSGSDEEFNILNIDVPILAEYTFDGNAIFFGPYLGFNIFGSVDTDQKKGIEVTNMNSVDYGLVIGYERHITKNMFMNIRFNYGLADVTKDDGSYNDFKSGKNIGVMLGAIFFFK